MRLLTYVVLLLSTLLIVACGQVEPTNPLSQSTTSAPTSASTSAPTVVAVAQSTLVPSAPPTSAPTIAATVQATQVPSAPPTSAPIVATPDQQVDATPLPSQPASSDVLVIYRKSGGFAGVNETMTVYSNGTVEVRDKDGKTQQVQVAQADIAMLTQLLASSDLAAIQSSSQPPAADAFVYEITVPSSTGKSRVIRTTDGADDSPALKALLDALGQVHEQVK